MSNTDLGLTGGVLLFALLLFALWRVSKRAEWKTVRLGVFLERERFPEYPPGMTPTQTPEPDPDPDLEPDPEEPEPEPEPEEAEEEEVNPYESLGEAPTDDVTAEDDEGDAGPEGIDKK